jgi:hypothetical protein
MFYSVVHCSIALAVFLSHYIERSARGVRTVDFSEIVWC